MKKSMKVLQVLDFINHNSGVSAVVMNYFLHMDKTKIQCDFLLYEPADEDLEQKITELGSKMYVTGQPSGREIVAYRRCIEQFFMDHAGEYDIVHVHIPNVAFIVLRAAKKYGVPARILHSHNARGADGISKKIRNFVLNKWGIRYANKYVACSRKAGIYLFGKRSLQKNKIFILQNAIEPEKYCYRGERRTKIRNELGIGEEILFGHIGRFCEQKNHKGLIDIFEKIRDTGVKSKLLLLGDGELRSQIEYLVKERGLTQCVIFKGIVNNVWDYMSAMDIFLLPSLYEGLPVVCIEAQVAGLPCIVSEDVTREIALTDHVKFVKNDDLSGWCKEVRRIMEMPLNREKLIWPDVYDIEKQARKLEEIYLQYGKSSDPNVNL